MQSKARELRHGQATRVTNTCCNAAAVLLEMPRSLSTFAVVAKYADCARRGKLDDWTPPCPSQTTVTERGIDCGVGNENSVADVASPPVADPGSGGGCRPGRWLAGWPWEPSEGVTVVGNLAAFSCAFLVVRSTHSLCSVWVGSRSRPRGDEGGAQAPGLPSPTAAATGVRNGMHIGSAFPKPAQNATSATSWKRRNTCHGSPPGGSPRRQAKTNQRRTNSDE